MNKAELPPFPRKLTLRDLLAQRCARHPSKIFLLDPRQKEEYSYARFCKKVNAVSNFLWDLGMRKDDKIALLMSSSPLFLWSYLGIMQLGAVACPVNIHLKENELAYILQDSDSVALFVTAEFMQTALQLKAQWGTRLTLLLWQDGEQGGQYSDMPGVVNLASLWQREEETLQPELAAIPLSPHDVAQLIYTSGTTGRPKGAMLTHHNLIIDAHWIAARHSLQEQDRAICVMPLFHINGQVVTVITPLYHGGSVVLPDRFSVTNFFPHIMEYGVTYAGTVATMLSMLLNRIEPVDMYKNSKLRVVFCGSAPVPVEVQAAFERAFNVPVIEGYGMTETACRSAFNLLPPRESFNPGVSDGYRKLGSVGLPLGNEMIVVDEQDRPLAAGQIGEIVLRGENVMSGYYKNPGATAQAFRHGWFHSGDLGYYDEDGYFYIVDRKSDMIIRGGENIYPREIEEVLYGHPAVKDAAVTGIPSDLYGEEVAAFVVLRDDASAGAGEIISFCAERLAAFKCPRWLRIVEEIPKSSSGKLLRRKLREML